MYVRTCSLSRQYCQAARAPLYTPFQLNFAPATGSQAFDRVSGSTVALKLYHLNKLNTISSHQVAREVGRLLLTAMTSATVDPCIIEKWALFGYVHCSCLSGMVEPGHHTRQLDPTVAVGLIEFPL